MKTLCILYHLALADFYERARSYRFLLTLAAIIYLGVLVNNGTLFYSIWPADWNQLAFRGEFNSAWTGTMTVLSTNTILIVFGFYLVSDCIERDIRTGVGQIIATTPLRQATYLAGKWLSNIAVLSSLELILAASAVIMALLKREAALDPVALLMPFLAVGLPCMALIAAFAVVFETVPRLRGAGGNVLYFFVALFLPALAMLGQADLPVIHDPAGFGVFRESLFAGIEAAYPNQVIGGMSVQFNPGSQFRVFNWPGLAWTAGIAAAQWLWVVIALGLVLLSATWFARFDPSREGRRVQVKPERVNESEQAATRKKNPGLVLPDFSPLISKLAQPSPFLGVLFAELRMLLNGRRWWWWLVIAGLNIAILVVPLSSVKQFLLPAAWLWPLGVWSEMGSRERKNNTYQMVFSSTRPVLRQLPAAWLAGVLATGLFGIGGAVVFLANGDLPALAGWVNSIVFIPTLALALGVVSSGNRLFEVIYLLWWYAGPFQKTPVLDFMTSAPLFYLLAITGLQAISAVWRGRQVRV